VPVPILSFKARLHKDAVSGKSALLSPEGVLLLSASAGEVLGLCDGTRSLDELVTQLAARHQVDGVVMDRDVRDCLERLSGMGLIELRLP
jgi:coenzyme PQQ biosynthesis protein PqqD